MSSSATGSGDAYDAGAVAAPGDEDAARKHQEKIRGYETQLADNATARERLRARADQIAVLQANLEQATADLDAEQAAIETALQELKG